MSEITYQEARNVLERLASPLSKSASHGQQQERQPEPFPEPVSEIGEQFLDRKWAKETLWTLVESLPDSVVVINDEGKIILCNRQTEETFGYSRSELLGQPVEFLVPEKLRDLHVQHRQKYFEQPRTRPIGLGMELFGIRKDGSEVPVEISLSPVKTDQGVVVTSVIRDISARKNEAAKFQTLVENIPAVSFFAPLDASEAELYVSPQIEQLLGFSQKEWLEDPVLWHRQLHPEDQERWNTQFAPTCVEGTPFESVYRFIAKDGRVVWVHGAANLVREREGQPLFLQGVAFDITAIKEAEESLRAQARLYLLEAAVATVITKISTLPEMLQECTQALVQHLDVAFARIWTFNDEEKVLELVASSGMYTHLNGAHSRVPIGKYKIGLIAQEARPHVSNDVCNDPRVSNQEWARREGLVAFAGYPLMIDERLVGVMAMFARHPLTEATCKALELIASHISLGIKRKQAEEELEQRVRRRTKELAESLAALEEKTEELEQFAHVAAHDFNEPLRSLVNYPQKLYDAYKDELDETAVTYLQRTLAGVSRMRRLIEDVRQYSKVLRRERVFESVDLNEVVESVRSNLQAAIQETQAQITADTLPTVLAHQTDLILLLQNLMGNAIKFRAPNRPLHVHVSARSQSNQWLISVRDNGIGMGEKYLKRIFELGERLHPASKYPGTGFGLAICEKILRTHQGRIWAESQEGEGTTFFFTLRDPAAAEEESPDR